MDNPFSTFVSGYQGGQALQMRRVDQQAQQDAQDAAQDALAAQTAYQQTQDTQRQANTDRAFGAGQKQQDFENDLATQRHQLDITKTKQSDEYHDGQIMLGLEKLKQQYGKVFADKFMDVYKQARAGGAGSLDAYTQAMILAHQFDHQGNPLTPETAAHMGQNNLHPFSQVGGQQGEQQGQSPFGQATSVAPSVIPPAVPSGVGGAPNPLQTPQLNYQTPADNPFSIIDRMQAGQGGLSSAPLPGVAAKIGQQQATTENLQARTATENALRDPKVQNLISMYTDRDKTTEERSRHDKAIEATANARVEAEKAYHVAQQALGYARLDSGGHTTDFKAVTALRGLQGTVDKYDKNISALKQTNSTLVQRKQTISDLMNAPEPPQSNVKAYQDWQVLQRTGPGIISGIDMDIRRHADEINASEQKARPWRDLLEQHRQEITSTGAPVKGSTDSGMSVLTGGASSSHGFPANPKQGEPYFSSSDGGKTGQWFRFNGGSWEQTSGPPAVSTPKAKPTGTIKPKPRGTAGTTKKGTTYRVLP